MSDLNDDFDADELMELADGWRPVSRTCVKCGGLTLTSADPLRSACVAASIQKDGADA